MPDRSFSLSAVPDFLDSRRLKSGLMEASDAAMIPMLPSAKAQFSSGTISHVTSTRPEDRGCSKGMSATVLPIAAMHTLRTVSSKQGKGDRVQKGSSYSPPPAANRRRHETLSFLGSGSGRMTGNGRTTTAKSTKMLTMLSISIGDTVESMQWVVSNNLRSHWPSTGLQSRI